MLIKEYYFTDIRRDMFTSKSADVLILARHCEPYDDDSKSGLSDEGMKQAALLAGAIQRFLPAGKQEDGIIISSTAPRADQTARILVDTLQFPKVFLQELERGNIEDIIEKLENLKKVVTIVVGHEPSLQEILYALGLTPTGECCDRRSPTNFNLLRHGQAYVINNTDSGKITRLPN